MLKTAVKDFANAKAFSTFTETGMAEHLRANGRFLYYFTSADTSFISVMNVTDVDCYDIGIHSNAGVATAHALGEHLRRILRSTVSTEITAESSCDDSLESSSSDGAL